MLRFNGGQWTHRCRDQNMKTGQEATARPKKLKGRCVRPRCPEGDKTQSVPAFHTLGGDQGIPGARELLPEL